MKGSEFFLGMLSRCDFSLEFRGASENAAIIQEENEPVLMNAEDSTLPQSIRVNARETLLLLGRLLVGQKAVGLNTVSFEHARCGL